MSHSGDLLHRLTALFVDSKLVPLTVLFALLLGVVAVLSTPSEEEPQIVVPMIDIEVSMPGASPREVEQRVVGPMEKLLWEIPGVEYVYSTAMDGAAMSIVRFTVGSNPEESLIKTYAKLYQHLDWIPPRLLHAAGQTPLHRRRAGGGPKPHQPAPHARKPAAHGLGSGGSSAPHPRRQ
jgi:multidrug efflux pump subunit AcrB